MSAPNKPATPRPYVSGGQVLSSPPLTARVRSFANDAYLFAGLYFTSLLSFDAHAAAEGSSFSVRNRVRGSRGPQTESRGWGGSGGSGGGAPGSGGSGGAPRGGRRLGTVDDVRGPECGSCG